MRSGGPRRTGAEVVVSCKSDLSDPTPTTSAQVETQREDTRTCEAGARFAADFGSYWVAHATGKPLASPPRHDDFVAVCRAMPDNVQRCLHAEYRNANADACDAVLQRLGVAERARIDGLYLQAPLTRAPAGN